MNQPSVVQQMPPTRPPRSDLEEEIANMLVAIEENYRRESSGYGSRFEGERLEVVQARAVISHVLRRIDRAVSAVEEQAEWDSPGAAADEDLRAELAEDAARDEAAERGLE